MITILILFLIVLTCIIGLITSSGQTQFQVEQICEFNPKNCFKPTPGRIAILKNTIHINVDNMPVNLKVIQKASSKGDSIYELSDTAKYYGFFILRQRDAVLDLFVRRKGLYTALFIFKEQ